MPVRFQHVLPRSLLTLGVACVGGLGGCDAAAPDAYRGDPIYVVEGPVFGGFPPEIDLAARRGRLRIALVWSGPGLADSVEYPSFGHDADAARYTLPVFDTAPLLGPWAVGRVLSYIDDDGDGRYGPGDRAAGALVWEGVLFVSEPLPAAASPTGLPLSPGLSMVPLPLRCGARPAPVGPACDVPIGALCMEGDPCGSSGQGICTRRQPRHWLDPVCLVTGRAPDCTPRDAVWVPNPDLDVWVPACASDADCPGDDMLCAAAIGACLSAGDGYMQRDRALPPVCVGDDT